MMCWPFRGLSSTRQIETDPFTNVGNRPLNRPGERTSHGHRGKGCGGKERNHGTDPHAWFRGQLAPQRAGLTSMGHQGLGCWCDVRCGDPAGPEGLDLRVG